MHHIDVSVRLNRLPYKTKYKKKPLLGLIPKLTCDVSLPFHIQQHMPEVFPVCHVVQRATKNKNNIYHYNDLQSIYLQIL